MTSQSIGDQLERTHRLLRESCQVAVPSRTSISVIDMNTLRLGAYGGGNLGFALGAYTRISITASAKTAIEFPAARDDSELTDSELIIADALQLWNSAVPLHRHSFHVRIDKRPPAHVGLASTAALRIAVLSGLNWLYGLPLTETEIRSFAAIDYSEPVEGRLTPAFTTGLSSFLNLYGGFAMISPTMEADLHLRVPSWTFVVAIPKDTAPILYGAKERETTTKEGCALDRTHSEGKLRIIHDRLEPALRSNSIREVGEAVHRIQQIGSKRAEMGVYGRGISDTIYSLKKKGVECVFFTAAGPGIVMISEQPEQQIYKHAKELGMDLICNGVLDNRGIILRTQAE